MLHRIRQLAIPIVILAGGAGGLMWLSSLKQTPERVVVPYQPPVVETSRVAEHAGSLPIRLHGVVVPYREIKVSAEVSGRVTFKADNAKAGKVVRQNSHLLSIDPEPHRLVLEQLDLEEKQLAVERQQLELQVKQNAELITLAERRFDLAKQDLVRMDKLKNENASIQAARDAADQAALIARTALLVLSQRAEQLPLQLSGLDTKRKLITSRRSQANLELGRTKIVAPSNAIISADEQEVGSYVEPGDHLFSLQDPSRFEIECSLRPDQLTWLQASVDRGANDDGLKAFELPEVTATVSYTADGETRVLPGRLVRTDGAGFDRATQTLGCRVVVDEPLPDADGEPTTLVAGMFVDVSIEVTPNTRLLALPRGALQPNGQVWELVDGKLQVHRVRPVRITSSQILLRQDRGKLKSGAKIVVSTLPMAFQGMTVREADVERPAP